MDNENNISDILDNELFYPCNDNTWYETNTHPSYSKIVLINTNCAQDEIQKLLMRKGMNQSTYARSASKIHINPDFMYYMSKRTMFTTIP